MTFTNAMGAWLLNALFLETTMSDRPYAKYSLKDFDNNGYISLYRLYMETNDPTEYTFATTHLGGWAHWERLCECDWFQPYVTRWRKELDLRFRAQALKNIQEIANNPSSRDKLAANKFLVNSGWVSTEAKGRGRPSKEDIKKEAHRLATEQHNLSDDYRRITEVN